MTTASHANAVTAHDEGLPSCEGVLELIADFKRTPPVVSPAARRRRRAPAPRDAEKQGPG